MISLKIVVEKKVYRRCFASVAAILRSEIENTKFHKLAAINTSTLLEKTVLQSLEDCFLKIYPIYLIQSVDSLNLQKKDTLNLYEIRFRDL